MITNGMMTSNTDLWATPQWLFDKLDAEFHFTLDVCANKENHKCKQWYGVERNGLDMPWDNEVCWMNPPYGRKIGEWVKKAYVSANYYQNVVVVCLLPARTDTKWWHDYVANASEIRFIKGRLKFGDAITGAPFPSAIVVFGTRHDLEVSHVDYTED